MADTARWTRQPDKRPDQIMEAALEVFAAKGFRVATMDEVAKAAGVTKGTIYLYFPSKKAVLLESVRREVDVLLELMPAVRVDGEGGIEGMARGVARSLVRLLMAPRMARLITVVMAEVNHLPELRAVYHAEMIPRANLALAEVLRSAMGLGIARELDPVIAARALLGMFLTFALTQEVFGAKEITPMDEDAIADTVVSIYLHGVLAR